MMEFKPGDIVIVRSDVNHMKPMVLLGEAKIKSDMESYDGKYYECMRWDDNDRDGFDCLAGIILPAIALKVI